MALDSRIATSLKDLHAKLTADGKLLSTIQLDQAYQLFRTKFGPNVLSAMDGEALLTTLHDHGNRASLVYWLEFKDDDEFPARFGSIAGGSALKFGIYRSKDSGKWMGRDDRNYPVEISTEEAIQRARKHRDELVAGSAVLEVLPKDASDANYGRLQAEMDSRAPTVSNLAWGHKYFSLLFPDKLDDFHVPEYQQFHLIKLLLTPPTAEGRYLAGGRFVAIAAELAIQMNHLTGVLNTRNGRPYRYWRIGTSDNSGRPRNRWALMRDGGCVAVGWSELGDLTSTTSDQEGKAAIKKLMSKHFPADARLTGRKGAEVFRFVHTIKEGDIVIACDGGKALGIGRVTGGYSYDVSSEFAHRRPVDWLALDEWPLRDPEGLRTTVHEVKGVPNRIEIEQRILAPAKPFVTHVAESGAKPAPRLAGIAGRIQSIIERKGQVILYGPPGTGKTFWALRAARDVVSYAKHGVAYENLSTAEKEGLTSLRICTFHPNYGYEDFIEGYRPTSSAGVLSYDLRDGLLKTLCRDASASPQAPHILIIDEINRGDIPRIFGELLTLLEKDKRGQSVLLPLSASAFSVPPNVFVIGTMNTADRSIALLDTALRRRFGFIELMPDPTVLGPANIAGLPLAAWLASLNRRVREHLGRDGRHLQIGHTYLMDGSKPIAEFAALVRAIREDILPLLIEYCYEDFDALVNIVGEGLVDRDQQRIREDLFDQGSQEDLVQALLSPDPEIVTSLTPAPAAVEDEEEEDEQPAPEADLPQ
jgi:5-methylcytosine-specific restriction protein B